MADEFTSGLDRQLANKAPDNFGREGHNGVALWGKQEMSERTEEGEPSYYFRPLVQPSENRNPICEPLWGVKAVFAQHSPANLISSISQPPFK